MKSHGKNFRIADSSVRTDLSISITSQIIFGLHDISFKCAHRLNMISFILVKITVCGDLFQIFSNIYQGCFTGTRYIVWMLERIIPLPVQTEYTKKPLDTISGKHAHILAMPLVFRLSQIAKSMGPTWGPSGSCRPQMGPMSALEPCYQGWDYSKWQQLEWSNAWNKMHCTKLFHTYLFKTFGNWLHVLEANVAVASRLL